MKAVRRGVYLSKFLLVLEQCNLFSITSQLGSALDLSILLIMSPASPPTACRIGILREHGAVLETLKIYVTQVMMTVVEIQGERPSY
ncbi:hypothetical protein F4814DRAFT_399246 [Daldinia grandis]|nr:hypothetical protein F4814DRAFT_399246 [Daldinia grandis]